MAIVKRTTRFDSDLYADAKMAAAKLKVTIQETLSAALRDLVESAEDPGKQAAKSGMVAIEKAQKIADLVRGHLLSDELEAFTRSVRRIIEGKT